MPRSNRKKKSQLKPPTKHPPTQESTSFLDREELLIAERAIANAKKHGIKLIHGTSNLADGNCAIESAILNVNDRDCFPDQMTFSVDYYRRIWMTDMKNRTLHDRTWNIYSIQEWEEGWTDMMQSGVYERGIFGDLMLFAIACGIRKVILIFNTSLDSPHDPVYICDPRKFGVQPNTDIPIVLAYDLSHYESMHTVEQVDVGETVKLVATYLTGKYSFVKADLPYLLELNESEDTNFQEENKSKINESLKDKGTSSNQFQENLPQHLQGKRPRDMNIEEKKEYNNLKRKMKRSNETNEQKELRAKTGAMRMASSREKETKRENMIRIEKNRNAKKRKRNSL